MMKQQKKKEAEFLISKEIGTWVLDDYLLFLGLSETSQKKHGATAGKVKANVIEHFRKFLERSNQPVLSVHIDSSAFIKTINLLLDVVKMQCTSFPYIPAISIGSISEINDQVKTIHDTLIIFLRQQQQEAVAPNHENSSNLESSNTNAVSTSQIHPIKYNFKLPPGVPKPTLRTPPPLGSDEMTTIQKETRLDDSSSE